MTDRTIVYNTAIPQTTDLLKTSKFAMLGDAFLAMSTLGNSAESPSTVVSGLACTPTSPATLLVNLGPGAIFSLDATDSSAYGDLGTDPIQIYKMGIRPTTGTLTITPPATVGYSQVFLVQAILSNIDGGSEVLSYYNSSNPAIPYSGPSNSGTSQFTTRTNVCTIALKAGVAATTGTQVTPSPDAGYIALYAITVANGQTQITSSNIVAANGGYAPFVNTALPYIPSNVQSGKWTYAADTSGTRSVITANLSPAITSYTAGLAIAMKMANDSSGASTVLLNGLPSKALVKRSGSATQAFDYLAGDIVYMVYDGTKFQMIGAQDAPTLTAPVDLYVNSVSGSDSNNGLTSGAAFQTLQKAQDTVSGFNLNGFNVTIHVASGTYARLNCGAVNGNGTVFYIGNTATPSLCTIAGAGTGIVCSGAGSYDFKGFKITTSGTIPGTTCAGLYAFGNGFINISYVEFGACTDCHMFAQNGGTIGVQTGTVKISGGANVGHMYLQSGGKILHATLNSPTLTISAAVSMPQFVLASGASVCGIQYGSITGSLNFAGKKYSAIQNSIIDVYGAGVNYLPGTIAGTTATGGQYT